MQEKTKHSNDQEGLAIEFEYTAPGTPQQNGHIKQKFATLFNQICATINGGKFITYLGSGLWAEVANTAMILKNHLITPNRPLSPFQHFFVKGKTNVLASMQKFGEMHSLG